MKPIRPRLAASVAVVVAMLAAQSAQAQTFKVLYSFKGGPDGANPYGAGVIRDSQGNLYGTTYSGGAYNGGVVYKLSKTGTESILHAFGGGADGANPFSGVIRDPAGNLYGTTVNGGSSNGGVVFQVDTSGKETVLYSFCSQSRCTDGANPGGE